MKNDPVLHGRQLNSSTGEPLERGEATVGDAGGDDQAEVVEVGRYVERKAMTRNPAGDAHTDGRQFLLPDPDSGQSIDTMRADAVIARRAHQDVFEIAHVAVHVAA